MAEKLVAQIGIMGGLPITVSKTLTEVKIKQGEVGVTVPRNEWTYFVRRLVNMVPDR